MNPFKYQAIAMAALMLAACGGGGDDAPAAQATITVEGTRALARPDAGTLAGIAGATTVAFLGIPYAQAPVANLRWKPPVPKTWAGTQDASQHANHCPQENARTDPQASEDCLYLNVHAPKAVAAGGAKRPVMVWIYGGANANGASDFYDPTALVEAGDVLVVTVNYRLGALGFLTHPALRDGAAAPGANFGVMDQQLALKWVRDNIAAFGGDPSNVTLFGESAGGLNITTHLVSPDSAGLFHKAIIQSGGYLLETPPLSDADARAEAFAAKLGCSSRVADCLRGKPVSEILAAQGTVNTAGAAYRQMVLDGKVLPEQQATALAAGRFHRVPVLLGSNANEGNLFFGPATTEAQYQATVDEFSIKNHRDPAQTRSIYPLASYSSAMAAASAVLGDAEFSCPSRRTSGQFAAHVPTWSYEFADPTSLNNSAHFAEIYHLFNYKNTNGMGMRGSVASQELALAMRRYWTNFARNGNPNGAGLPSWPAYTVVNRQVQMLTPPVPSPDASPAASDFSARHRCGYWG